MADTRHGRGAAAFAGRMPSSHFQSQFENAGAEVRPFVLRENAEELSRDALISQVLFASRDLAQSRFSGTGGAWLICFECQRESASGHIQHASSCRVGRVLGLLDRICVDAQDDSIRKEDAPTAEQARAEEGMPSRELAELAKESSERLLACVRFCAGIPTEVLERQLPLASSKRMRWEDIHHLRRALPFLQPVEVEL